jgi:hypothetical protein
MADPADIQLNLNQDQDGQVVQQNVPARAQTTLAFKVEQSEIPDFWGQKAKDTVTVIVFIRIIALTLVPVATSTGTANTIFSANYRIIPKVSARKESGKINRVETSKDVPTGRKCM